MRIDSVQLAHALAKSQSSIRPAATVIQNPAGRINELGHQASATQPKSKIKNKKNKKKMNWDGLGSEIDEWV
jgi:hypothetical protein